jgi:alanyl aminopeptidase
MPVMPPRSRIALLAFAILFVGAAAGCLVPPRPQDVSKPPRAAEEIVERMEVSPDMRADGRLPVTVVPVRYELDFEIDPRESRFSARATIAVSVPRVTNFVVLHAGDFFVRSIAAQVGSHLVAGVAARPHGEKWKDAISIAFDEPLPAGAAKLSFVYDAPFAQGEDPRGLFRRKEPSGWYAFSQLEPSGAREMFPSFDEPGFKVPFDITVTVPAGMSAFGNMPEVSRELTQAGTRIRFATTPPLPTYLVAVAVGEFEVIDGPTAPVPLRLIRPIGRPGAAGPALEAAAALVPVLSDLVGHGFPFPKLDLVAVTAPFRGAMENAGLITFAADLLLLETRRPSVWKERDMIDVLAHEIAHQWAGDLVTPRWWDDIWLNEGFATFLAARAVDKWRPAFGSGRVLLANIERTMDGDLVESQAPVRKSVHTVQEIERILHSGIEYVKGAAWLGMIERYVGKEAFARGFAKYLRDNAWKSVATDDFVAAIEASSGKALTPFANAFLDRPGVPVLSVEPSCKGDRFQAIVLRQEALAYRPSDPPSVAPWAIPFCASAGASDPSCNEVRVDRVALPFETSAASCRSWLDPNPGLAGYYRYEVSDEDLDRARSMAPRLAPEAKLGLLYNAWASVRRKHLKPDAVLRFLPALDAETDAEVLNGVVHVLTSARGLIAPRAERSFEAYARARFLRHKARLGLGAANHRAQSLGVFARSAALWGLEIGGDEDIAARARSAVDRALGDPTKPVDPEIGRILFAAAGRRIDVALLERLAEQVAHPALRENRELALVALGSIEDAVLLRRALDLSLRLELTPREVAALTWIAAENVARRKTVFDWIVSEWKAISQKWSGGALWGVLNVAAFACEDEQKKALEKLVADLPVKDAPWLVRAFADAEQCHDLREFGKVSLEAYLSKF